MIRKRIVIKAEALRLASKSRRTQATVRWLDIRSQLLYRWQQTQLVVEGAANPEV